MANDREPMWQCILDHAYRTHSDPEKREDLIRSLANHFSLTDRLGARNHIIGSMIKSAKKETFPTILKNKGFGKEVIREYLGRAEKEYGNPGTLSLGLAGKDLYGSTPHQCVLFNKILKPAGFRTSTPADLERILRNGSLDLKSYNVNSALVLWGVNTPNNNIDYLAQRIYDRIMAKQGEVPFPMMIPFSELNLRKDSNSEYGLSFDLADDAHMIHAPILNKPEDSTFDSRSILPQTGLPIKTGRGNRELCIPDYSRFGLSRLGLRGGRSIGDCSGFRSGCRLDYSGVHDRIVIVDYKK